MAKTFTGEVTVVEINGLPAIILKQDDVLERNQFVVDNVVSVTFSYGGKSYVDIQSVMYSEEGYYVYANSKVLSVGDTLTVTIEPAETPRYEVRNKRILRIGASLAISINEYQKTAPAVKKFRIGDQVYVRITKGEQTYSAVTRISTYGSSYIVYLNTRWGFKASDVVDIVIERMID